MMAELQVGQMAPSFQLPTQTGETISLEDYRGQVVVLYFYPKDDTPGCTKEACGFRDFVTEFRGLGAVILGVSRDSVKSHLKFAEKYQLNFPLLADENGEVCEAYGVLKNKNMFGRQVFGIERTTFIIDREGKIAKIFPKVKVDEHVNEVLAAVESL
jgi:thioredoxin-dependent peroxiredoxin